MNPISPVEYPCCNRDAVGVVQASGQAMRRREFIKAIAGATVALPVTAHAQQPGKLPIIGFVSVSSADLYTPMMAAFEKSLGEAGFYEDRNVRLETRWADGHYEKLPALISDLLAEPRNKGIIQL